MKWPRITGHLLKSTKESQRAFSPSLYTWSAGSSITGTCTTACPSSQAKSEVMSMPRQLPKEDDKAVVRQTQSSPPAEEEDEKHIVTFSINQAPLQPVPQGESPFYRCVKPPDCYYIVEEEISPLCTLFHQGLRHSTWHTGIAIYAGGVAAAWDN